MDYILQKELHKRSLSLLELREKAVKRLRTAEDDLYKFERMGKVQRMYCFYNLSDYEWRVKVCTRSLSFIEGVYERHMWKMRDTIPWKSGWMLPNKPCILNLSEDVPKIEYWETPGYKKTVLPMEFMDFTDKDLLREYKEVLKFPISFEALPEKGLVEPVGVSYEETYSPRSTGYQ